MLPRKYLCYFYVRRLSRDIAQVRVPDGILIEPLDDIFINDEIYGRKVYNKLYKIKRKDIIIDVGAHVGVFSLKASRKANEGKVISIEPHPVTYNMLVKNIRRNKRTNVISLNLALGEFNGTTKLYLSKYPREYSTVIRRSDKYLRVPLKTLDQLLQELKLSKVDFIKIDAEGAELDILKGAEEALKQDNIFLTISGYHTSSEIRDVCNYLAKKGFKIAIDENEKIVHAQK